MVSHMERIPLVSEAQQRREQYRKEAGLEQVWSVLDQVKDPEIPVLSIWDLGILQEVEQQGGKIRVTITPTYSGCPAMHEITRDIQQVLNDAGYSDVTVETRLAPAWTTDWMTAEGKQRLVEFGIAAPMGCTADGSDIPVTCPQCGSEEITKISEFGSTACKALYQCKDCQEPFDYFKCI